MHCFSQTRMPQGIKLTISEKTKKGSKPVTSGQIEISFNDSIKMTLVPDNEGCVGVIPLNRGAYDIKCKYQDCLISETKNIVVGEGKTAFVTMALTCPTYLNSLTKKEKKRLGIK